MVNPSSGGRRWLREGVQPDAHFCAAVLSGPLASQLDAANGSVVEMEITFHSRHEPKRFWIGGGHDNLDRFTMRVLRWVIPHDWDGIRNVIGRVQDERMGEGDVSKRCKTMRWP